jgi:hypothetical protein
VWAAAIMVFALIAVLGLVLGYRRHRASGALMLGIVGAFVVIFSLYGSRIIRTMGIPRDAVEIVGFAGLEQPRFIVAIRTKIVANAHLGRLDEARADPGRMPAIDSKLTIAE